MALRAPPRFCGENFQAEIALSARPRRVSRTDVGGVDREARRQESPRSLTRRVARRPEQGVPSQVRGDKRLQVNSCDGDWSCCVSSSGAEGIVLMLF